VNFTLLFWTICGIYSAGWLFCGLSFFSNTTQNKPWGERLLFLGMGFQIFFIIAEYIELGNSIFDSLSGLFLFLSLLIIVIFFILDFTYPNQIFKIVFPPLVIFFLILSVAIYDQAIIAHGFLNKSPVFGKFLLYVHASCSMLGYLLFGVGCLTSIFFLYQEKKIKNKTLILQNVKVPSLGFLDTLNYKVITAGFLFLTVGILLGINMKIISSGGHVNLDVSLRQILPISTWTVYAIFLVDRFVNGLRGKTTAIWAITGFCVAIGSFAYEISLLIQR